MQDVLPEVTAQPWPVPVLDGKAKYIGAISKNVFFRTLQRGQEEQNRSDFGRSPLT